MKLEISQQVKELRAQKHNRRGRSPGYIPEHSKSAGQGPNKGPVKSPKQGSGYLLEPSSQKGKHRDRPLSVPSQPTIKGLMSQDSQLKARPHPISPGQIQNPAPSKPMALLVSAHRRGRSHSPCNRIDVDIELDNPGGWHKSLSHDSLTMSLDSEAVDQTDLLSQSFPANALCSALSKHRNSYSPAPSSSNLLQVPDNNHLLFPLSDRGMNSETWGQHAIRGSSSMCDLSASAPAGLLNRSMNNINSRSSNSPSPWLCLSPRNSPQIFHTHSPTSSVSLSTSPVSPSSSFFSPPFSPESPGFNIESPYYPTLVLPNQTSFPNSSPHCSPQGSPFGSQSQIVRSVGATEC